MGWVTLSLRKKELQRTHSDLQMRDLEISREQRQMARQKMYDQTVIQNDQGDALDSIRNGYRGTTSQINDDIAAQRAIINDPNSTDQEKEAARQLIDKYNSDIRAAQEEYQYAQNEIKSQYETELQMLEEEANDREVMLENEKVEVETLMEAVAAELQAVGEAISQEIQNSTIKLK